MKGSERDTICIPELEELARMPMPPRSGYSTFPPEVDDALRKYAPMIHTSAMTWAAIAKELNSEFGMAKTKIAYIGRYKRIRT